MLASNFALGVSSIAENIVLRVPPENPPLTATADVEFSMAISRPPTSLSVLLARWTTMSDGIESNPDAGTMIAPDLDAA